MRSEVLLLLVFCITFSEMCPDGWQEFNSNCYKYFDTIKTWEVAEAVCNNQKLGGVKGHLTSVNSKEENDFVAGLSNRNIWLGGNDRNREGNWMWSDGPSISNYKNWGGGEPNDWADNEDCMQFYSSNKNWNDLRCSYGLTFVCKIKAQFDGNWGQWEPWSSCNSGKKSRTRKCDSPAPSHGGKPCPGSSIDLKSCSDCPDGWKEFNGYCYKYVETTKTWEEAEAVCNDQKWGGVKGHLTSVNSIEENDFVGGLSNRNIWLGGNDRNREGDWMWSDGQSISNYKNWGGGEPNDWADNEDCMQFYSRNKNWNDLRCTYGLPFVCKIKGTESTCTCGRRHKPTRIVGGSVTDVNEYPWMAFVKPLTPCGDWGNCGGSLLNNQWVLTAAHCIYDTSSLPEDNQVQLGQHDFAKDPTKVLVRSIEKGIMHPQYDNNTADYDFALLKLSSKVDFSLHTHVQPICLPKSHPMPSQIQYDEAVVAGWGLVSDKPEKCNTKMKHAEVDCMSNNQCDNYWYGWITPRMLCAKGKGSSHFCSADSGSPLMELKPGSCPTCDKYWELIGVVSWNDEDCVSQQPDVYGRVASVVDWIETTIAGDGSVSCTPY